MKCNHCGYKIDGDSKYCSHCGKKQVKKEKQTPEQNNSKKPLSDGKIALIVLGTLGIFFFLLVLSVIFFITRIDYHEEPKTYINPTITDEQKYTGKEPVLKRNYKQVNTVTTNGFSDMTKVQAVSYLTQMGFTTIEENRPVFDDDCVYEVSGKSFPYENVYDRDHIEICFDNAGKMSELNVKFVFTASDFDYDKASTEVINASRNFHNFTLNSTMMKEAFDELRQSMKKFEKYPSAEREETVSGCEITYEFEYEDESSYSPAKYMVELNIEKDD